ncbi:MAG: hypoxanthine phosphoribosyltransferase [Bacteroidetes bacterium]|nr:hypoxanthine phosphoribosyltransferase [Bacteroidota bacterium]
MVTSNEKPSRIKVRDKFFRLYLSKEKIDEIVSGIARSIDRDYSGKTPLCLGILNGAFIFASDLMRKLQIPCEISFVKYSSYHGMESGEKVNRLIGLNETIRGRDVIIVEDIVDTGLTMTKLLYDLKQYQPASVSIACFCFKKEAFRENFKIDYCGLEIPKLFVVGYGLDYDGAGRNFPDIYQLDETDQ